MIIDKTFVGIKQQQGWGYGAPNRLAARARGEMAGPGEAKKVDANGAVTFEVSGGMSSRMFVCIIFIN